MGDLVSVQTFSALKGDGQKQLEQWLSQQLLPAPDESSTDVAEPAVPE